MKTIFIFASVLVLSGCATKQYPQSPAVTSAEAAAFDCQSIKVELAKADSLKREIDTTGEFDGRTILGVLGDFGIGNGMAKSEAYQKADARIQQLESLRLSKCANVSS